MSDKMSRRFLRSSRALYQTLLYLSASLWACAASDHSGPAPHAVRDSAGIRIIESTRPAWTEREAWHVNEPPHLQIGAVESDRTQVFHEIRDAAMLADGRIVVADGGSHDIRVYAADGRFLHSFGGLGDGPGEFRALSSIHAAGTDTVIAFDRRLDRITMFRATGSVLGTVTVRPHRFTLLRLIGRLADGRYIFAGSGALTDGPGPQRALGLHRDPVWIVLAAAAGTITDTVGVFQGTEMRIVERDGRRWTRRPPFGRTTAIAVHANHVYVGTQESYEVLVLNSDGRLERIIRNPVVDLRLSSADIEAARARANDAAGGSADGRSQVDRRLDAGPLPPQRPAFGRLLVDAGGHLWLADYEWPRADAERWTVFAPDGRMLGRVAVPARFGPLYIGEDYVLGRWRDDNGVEFIRKYALARGS